MASVTPPGPWTLLLILLGSFVCARALTACTTPGGQSGQCVSKQSCDPVAKLLRASNQGSHPTGPSYKQLYGSPACDSAGLYEEKVCCPVSDAGKQDDGESGEDSDDVSERRLGGRRPRPTRPQFSSNFDRDREPFGFGGLSDSFFTTRRPLSRDPLLGGFGSQDPFGFGSGGDFTTTRRPSRNPFETEFGGGGDSRRPTTDIFAFGFGNEFTTTRRPDRDPFGFNEDRDRTTRRPNRDPFGFNEDRDRTTRRPNRDPFGSNEDRDRTTRRPNRDPFGSNEDRDRTTRRPNRDPFGSNEDRDRTTRRPNRDPFGSNEDRTTRRPAFVGDSTTRRPNRDRTTRRPSQQGGSGGGQLINPEGCGPINMDRIIGGNSTAVFELPWMARLGYGRGRSVSYRCGGSLINSRYVLSAAHCMGGGDNPTQIRLGEHDAQSREDCSTLAGERVCAPPVVDVDVEEVIRHPEYSDDENSPNYLKNDIALIRLRSPVSFTDAVRPICLPEGSFSSGNLEGKKVAVAGWGKDKNRGSSGTRFLMKANLPYTSFSQCSRVYQQRGISLEEQSQLCAGGERGVDSCQGDSGGPLYRPATVNGAPSVTQLGVVSFGLQNCAVEGVPGVYTRVEHFMPWITRNMRT